MHIIIRDNITEAYHQLLLDITQIGEHVGNTKEINNCCIQVKDPTTKELYFPFRKISEKYAEAELKWYWSGSNSMEEIAKHAKLWAAISDDGKTSNSAYGYIIRSKYLKDQLQEVIKILYQDENSRRAVINISDPTLDKRNTKDFQCTIAIQFLIRNDALEMTVYMRSNDVYFGLPYDYIFFVSLGEYVSYALRVPFRLYTHHATSMHMYERDFDKFKDHDQITKLDVEKIIKENYDEKYEKYEETDS